MALPNLYSRRKRLAEKQGDDVYQYEIMSPKLRNQILFIIEDWEHGINDLSDTIVEEMRIELGKTRLSNHIVPNVSIELRQWFLECSSIEHLLDAVEIAIKAAGNSAYRSSKRLPKFVRDGVEKLNARMLEADLGFQIENGQAIQTSSTFIHKVVTVPALGLLSSAEYKSAEEEFRKAYAEFNLGNFDGCIHDCCNAFESVLKIIIEKKGWGLNPNDNAGKLLAVVFDKALIPSYMQNEFNGLRTILESGVPTVRNKDGGHGAGVKPRNIPKHIAAFQLHQTAAAIVLLVEAAK